MPNSNYTVATLPKKGHLITSLLRNKKKKNEEHYFSVK